MKSLCRKAACAGKKAQQKKQIDCAGQVMLEYVIMLVFAVVLVLALSLLYTVTTDRGHRMIDSVSWNIP
ncbi:MAG: hypothetical protein IJZ19_15925 [Lentisphaeria bacterium]|nr:hypothetical protein [Lentisphaeria bacterium]MBQ8756515.1 hypothetical protein [Lentisphaeria bacterium]MBQ9776430.1 hypothetical protein [Lentisphaeria bacterium]